MPVAARFILLILFAAVLPACVPSRLSRECRNRIHECLQRCPPKEHLTDGSGPARLELSIQNRTGCDHQCHALCTWGADQGSDKGQAAVPNPDEFFKDKQEEP